MTHDEILKKHRDLFTDDQDRPSCAYIEAHPSYFPLIDMLLSQINDYLQTNVREEPFYITKVHMNPQGLEIVSEGECAVIRGMILMTSQLSGLFNPSKHL